MKSVSFAVIFFSLCLYLPLNAQQNLIKDFDTQTSESSINIISVNDIKAKMAEKFESIDDYTADFVWINSDVHYKGKMQYKKPDKILLTFEEPSEQKIVSNGNLLYIYIPYLKVVVQQLLTEETESSIIATTSEAGLSKLFDEYSFSFYDTSTLQPYRNTKAYHLKLSQKTPKVGFKKMDIWVSEGGLILQSNGISPNGINVSLIFSNIKLNTELPDYIFDFEVPADAQIIRNIIVPFSD